MSSRPRRTSAPIVQLQSVQRELITAKSCLKLQRRNDNESLPSKKCKKQVAFFHEVVAHKHLHINNFSKKEYESTWYSPKEMHTIRRKCKKLVHKLNTRIKGDENDTTTSMMIYCQYLIHGDIDANLNFRGLEGSTILGGYLREQHKNLAWGKVCLEQDRQLEEFGYVIDPERLASIYHQSGGAEACAMAAYHRALIDHSFEA